MRIRPPLFLNFSVTDKYGRLGFDPDLVMSRTDLDASLVHCFLQWNCVNSIMSSNRQAEYLFPQPQPSTVEESSSPSSATSCTSSYEQEPDVLDQLHAALSGYTDVDVILSRYESVLAIKSNSYMMVWRSFVSLHHATQTLL
jgi:hypothetical protein